MSARWRGINENLFGSLPTVEYDPQAKRPGDGGGKRERSVALPASAVRNQKHNFTRRYLKSLFDRFFGEIALKSWRRSANIVVLEIQAEYRRKSFSVYLP